MNRRKFIKAIGYIMLGGFLNKIAGVSAGSSKTKEFKKTDVENKTAHDHVLELLIDEHVAKFKSQLDGHADARAVHVETILSNLGALAGFGCQMAIREALIKPGRVTEKDAFIVVETKNSQKYYFGDMLNEPLLSTKEGRISVYSLVGGAAQSVGAKSLPDINEIAKYYADKIGDPEYFQPRIPKEHMPKQLPVEALGYWSSTRTLQILHQVDPLHWGWTYALAAQKLIIESKDIIDPELAAKIVMEAAIPMAKMDPERVEGAYFNK